jgi:hypothetical protein
MRPAHNHFFRLVALLALLAGALLLPATASALPAGDQYTEQLPTGGGNKPTDDVRGGSGGGGSNGSGGSGGGSTAASGGGFGGGEAAGLAAQADASAPESLRARRGSAASGDSAGPDRVGADADAGTDRVNSDNGAEGEPDSPGDAEVAGLLRDDDPGLGLLFPLLLAGSLLAAVVLRVLRERGAR